MASIGPFCVSLSWSGLPVSPCFGKGFLCHISKTNKMLIKVEFFIFIELQLVQKCCSCVVSRVKAITFDCL